MQAVVVAHADTGLTEGDVLDWCRSRMAGYKRPQSVLLVSEAEIPRTATGKILHRVLRERLAQREQAPA